MDYKNGKKMFVNENDKKWEQNCNRHLWDEWELQIRKDERKKIFSNLANEIIKELGDDTIELIKELQERYN